MKKIIILFLIGLVLFTGCGNNNIKNKFIKKYNLKNYKLNGELQIKNNDEVYTYNVVVGYKKDCFYKVELTNVSNNHTQIILKNEDGVYVITPSLNKSFRFQSDWPNAGSQIYLIDSLINDVLNDKNVIVDKKNNFISTKVSYLSNSKLIRQKIELKADGFIKKVSVFDNDNVEIMNLKVNKIDIKPKFNSNYLRLMSIKLMKD